MKVSPIILPVLRNIFGINNMKPNGHNKVKIVFDSIFHADKCLDSLPLSDHKPPVVIHLVKFVLMVLEKLIFLSKK